MCWRGKMSIPSWSAPGGAASSFSEKLHIHSVRVGIIFSRIPRRTASNFPPNLSADVTEQDGTRLTIKPYSGVEAQYEIDFFGNTLTLIRNEETFGESATYEALPGSEADVRAKADEAEAFLSRENWQVGVWEIRDAVQTVDLTIRPDGHYIAKDDTEFFRGIVRGRYTLSASANPPFSLRRSGFVCAQQRRIRQGRADTRA